MNKAAWFVSSLFLILPLVDAEQNSQKTIDDYVKLVRSGSYSIDEFLRQIITANVPDHVARQVVYYLLLHDASIDAHQKTELARHFRDIARSRGWQVDDIVMTLLAEYLSHFEKNIQKNPDVVLNEDTNLLEDEHVITPLEYELHEGNDQAAEFLLRDNDEFSPVSKTGMRFLTNAIAKNMMRTARLLVDRGAPLNFDAPLLQQPFLMAAQSSTQLFESLIKSGRIELNKPLAVTLPNQQKKQMTMLDAVEQTIVALTVDSEQYKKLSAARHLLLQHGAVRIGKINGSQTKKA